MRNLSAADLNPIISLNFIRHFFNSFFAQLFNLLKANRLRIVFRLLNRKSKGNTFYTREGNFMLSNEVVIVTHNGMTF